MSDPLYRSARPLERLGMGLLGAQLAAAAALCAALARGEMSLRAIVCGVDHPGHCGWCVAAIAFGLMSATVAWRTWRPARTAL